MWVERARRPPGTRTSLCSCRPPRAQSWGGAPGGGTGPGLGVPPEDKSLPGATQWRRGASGRPPAAAADVWVCWVGGNRVWREWGRPVGATALQPDRVWTLRKGRVGIEEQSWESRTEGAGVSSGADPGCCGLLDPLSPLLGSSGKPPFSLDW